MRSLLIIFLVSSFPAQAKVVAHYTYLRAKKPSKKTITWEELKRAYAIIKESTFTPPDKETFFNDYIRFKMGIDVALHEKKLVRNPEIENSIVDPFLRKAFQTELYKALAELKLKKQMERLDKSSANLSDQALRKLYAKEPEFNLFFITAQHPINPSKKQIQEAQRRAKQIHGRVIKSKKPFLELVALYSDDKSNGVLAVNRPRAAIFPSVYAKLKSMKNNSISSPIRIPSGYMIVKLNQRVPFSSADKMAIKSNYFNKSRSKIFNSYFDGLKKDFKLNVVNRALVNKI